MADKQQKEGKKHKRPDTRPARNRYWARQTLKKRKIRNLMKHNGLTRRQAEELWTKVRKKRMRPLFQKSPLASAVEKGLQK